jgi:hypothetical protein
MIDKPISGATIARTINVNPSMVWNTIAGRRTTFRVRKAIAEALGVDVAELWPPETASLRKAG